MGAQWRDNLGARRRDSHFLLDNVRAAARQLGARRRDSHMMMIAFITFKSSLVPLFEGL